MKFWKRFKRFLHIQTDVTLDRLEKPHALKKFEYELKKSKESLDQIQTDLSHLRASKRVEQENKDEYVVHLEKLESVLQQAVEKNDRTLGTKAIQEKKLTETKIHTTTTSIGQYEKYIEKLENQYNILKAKYDQKLLKYKEAETLNNCAKNFEKVNDALKKYSKNNDMDFSNFESIEQEIKKDLYFQLDRNEVLNQENESTLELEKPIVDEFDLYVEEYNRKKESKPATATVQIGK